VATIASDSKQLVIGAGPIGLAMAAALKHHGVAYDQIDVADGVGGNWRHGVYRTAHIVSSKRATAYADYPMPEHYPDFPSAGQMLAYLEDFARDRDLLAHCTFGREVTLARPLPSGLWQVTFADGAVAQYKGVVVCNGHHWERRIPESIAGFSGEVLHSKDYRDPAQLAGKRVLVIGGGNSGVDMACYAANVGSACDISLRSGYWYLPKTFAGRPLTDIPIWGLPVFLQRLILKGIVRLAFGSYSHYGLPHPNHRLFERHPAFGNDLLNAIRLGKVEPRPDIAGADGQTVRFVDGSTGDYDLIVTATGFHTTFPFLPEGLVEMKNGALQAYAGAFVKDVRGLCIVGWAQARNGFGKLITPLADLYARMIVLQDELSYPIANLVAWTESPPTTHLLNPEQIQRDIWLGRGTLFMLRWFDKGQAYLDRRRRGRVPPSQVADAASGSYPRIEKR
jgi:cation diffusion facilitator CzcD-associated flavoprotein CzcO